MKVILTQTVPKVGKKDSVVNVADGYARNYLFARGLATVAEPKQVEALNRRIAKEAEKTAGQKASAEALGAELHGKSIRIEGQVGQSTGKLFGAITSQNIADAIAAQLGKTLDKKQIALIEPIKRLGTHQVELDLHRDVHTHVNVVIFDPSVVEEAPAAAETTEAPAETTEEN